MKAVAIGGFLFMALILSALLSMSIHADDGEAEIALKVNVTAPKNVDIDIIPFSYFNVIIPWSNGLIPVSILSSADFDAASEVDARSLTFGHTGHEDSLHLCLRHPIDTNRDGLRDKLCFFRCRQAGFHSGDTEGILKGKTVDGAAFQGKDSVIVFYMWW